MKHVYHFGEIDARMYCCLAFRLFKAGKFSSFRCVSLFPYRCWGFPILALISFFVFLIVGCSCGFNRLIHIVVVLYFSLLSYIHLSIIRQILKYVIFFGVQYLKNSKAIVFVLFVLSNM